MDEPKSIPASSKILRWIARIWSLLLAGFALVLAFTPDPTITGPVPFEDWFLLAFWGVAIMGLLIAWWWENVGATISIGTMLLRELAWVILKGDWVENFLIVWALIVPPAILFLAANRLQAKAARSTG
jgi:Na+/proline symporter